MREMSKEGLGLKDPTDKLSGGTQVSALQGHLPNWPETRLWSRPLVPSAGCCLCILGEGLHLVWVRTALHSNIAGEPNPGEGHLSPQCTVQSELHRLCSSANPPPSQAWPPALRPSSLPAQTSPWPSLSNSLRSRMVRGLQILYLPPQLALLPHP